VSQGKETYLKKNEMEIIIDWNEIHRDLSIDRTQSLMIHFYNFFLVAEAPDKLVRVFVPGKLFQPILIFASKAGGYSSGAPFSKKTLVLASGLTHID